MWTIIAELAAAVYLIGLASIISTEGAPSGFLFRFLPLITGIPLAFIATARIMGWPV